MKFPAFVQIREVHTNFELIQNNINQLPSMAAATDVHAVAYSVRMHSIAYLF